MKNKRTLLFLTWDGPQVKYLESLFGPILSELRSLGMEIHVLQFTWKPASSLVETERACRVLGLTYEAFVVFRHPKSLGALLTTMLGAWRVLRLFQSGRADLILARSLFPALCVLMTRLFVRCRFVYDSDGLLADEMVEFGSLSRTGLVFRALKLIERFAVRGSHVVLARSQAGSSVLRSIAGEISDPNKFYVVRNGRDSSRFCLCSDSERMALRLKMGIAKDTPLVIYVGSLGPKYSLAEMLALFQEIRLVNNRSVMLLLTGELNEYDRVEDQSLKIGVRAMHVSSDEVPKFLQIADLGLSLIRQTFSMTAASAVKTGEYLLCGVPVVATRAVGDIGSVLTSSTGVLIDDPCSPAERRIVVRWFLESVLPQRETYMVRCRDLGLREFSLPAAVADYSRAIGPLFSAE